MDNADQVPPLYHAVLPAIPPTTAVHFVVLCLSAACLRLTSIACGRRDNRQRRPRTLPRLTASPAWSCLRQTRRGPTALLRSACACQRSTGVISIATPRMLPGISSSFFLRQGAYLLDSNFEIIGLGYLLAGRAFYLFTTCGVTSQHSFTIARGPQEASVTGLQIQFPTGFVSVSSSAQISRIHARICSDSSHRFDSSC